MLARPSVLEFERKYRQYLFEVIKLSLLYCRERCAESPALGIVDYQVDSISSARHEIAGQRCSHQRGTKPNTEGGVQILDITWRADLGPLAAGTHNDESRRASDPINRSGAAENRLATRLERML